MFRKNLFLLALCQGLMLSGTSLIMTSSALVGVLLAPDSSYATLPLGVTFVCMMLTTIPASLLMQRFGRRTGFTLGGTAGLTAGVVCAIAILEDSFVLFCLGSGCYGVASGFAQFYRFAAAEVVDKSYKSRAISWVLAGGLVAAFVGPNVARVTRDIIPGALFSASYACVALFSLGVIVTQFYLRIPLPAREESADPVRSLNSILTQPVFLVAVLCAMIAYSTMNLLMVATPLAMHAGGMNIADTAMVIQWHIVGMFAPSFFTGNLIYRFGVLQIMFVGVILLLACTLVTLFGQAHVHFFVALALLGLGWNFLFVGGTILLTEAYRPGERGVVQGINDLMVFSATAFTAMTSGYFYHTFGWVKLNHFTIPVICFAGIIVVLLAISRRSRYPEKVTIR